VEFFPSMKNYEKIFLLRNYKNNKMNRDGKNAPKNLGSQILGVRQKPGP